MGSLDLINMVQGRDRRRAVVNAVMNFWVLQTVEYLLSSRGPVSFSRRAFAAFS